MWRRHCASPPVHAILSHPACPRPPPPLSSNLATLFSPCPLHLLKPQTKALKYELQTQIANPLLGDIEDVQPDSPISNDAEVGAGRPGNRRAAEEEEEDESDDGGGCCCFGGKKPMSPLELRAENDRRRTLGMPLLDEEAGLTAKEAREKRKEVRREDGGRGGGGLVLKKLAVGDVCVLKRFAVEEGRGGGINGKRDELLSSGCVRGEQLR